MTCDVEGLSRPVSHWVHTSTDAATVGADGAAAMAAPGQVATLILPSDTAWNEGGIVAEPIVPPAPEPVDGAMVDKAAVALRGSDSLVLPGGEALSEDGLATASRIAQKTGCELRVEGANARWRRGAGRARIDRLSYPINIVLEELKPFRRIVHLGAKEPVAFFAYPDKPDRLTA